MMFSNLPSDRATSTLKALESQFGNLKRMLGTAATDWPEKVSIYAFSSRKDFIEFVRTVEARADVDARGNDQRATFGSSAVRGSHRPAGGHEGRTRGREKRKTRGRRGEDRATDSGGATAVCKACSPSRSARRSWRRPGIPALAGPGDRRVPGFAGRATKPLLQASSARPPLPTSQQGWPTRANEALGGSDQITPDGLRSVVVRTRRSHDVRRNAQGFPRLRRAAC